MLWLSRKIMNKPTKPDFTLLDKMCKLISKYHLKELTIHQDGSVTIVKELHTQPKTRLRKPKRPKDSAPLPMTVSDADLALVAARLPTPGLNDLNRYHTRNILPKQGKD